MSPFQTPPSWYPLVEAVTDSQQLCWGGTQSSEAHPARGICWRPTNVLAAKETVLSKTVSAVLCCPSSCPVVPRTSQPQSWRSTAVLSVRSVDGIAKPPQQTAGAGSSSGPDQAELLPATAGGWAVLEPAQHAFSPAVRAPAAVHGGDESLPGVSRSGERATVRAACSVPACACCPAAKACLLWCATLPSRPAPRMLC